LKSRRISRPDTWGNVVLLTLGRKGEPGFCVKQRQEQLCSPFAALGRGARKSRVGGTRNTEYNGKQQPKVHRANSIWGRRRGIKKEEKRPTADIIRQKKKPGGGKEICLPARDRRKMT